jgi:hypothetical protein
MFWKTKSHRGIDVMININEIIVLIAHGPLDPSEVVMSHDRSIFLNQKEYKELADFLPQITGS